mgnify:CR=1 FL=1
MDICMAGTNGIETARQLREKDPRLLIVFVTSSPEYVWDAFPVHPFDYLLKPYKEEKIALLTAELRRVLCRQEPELDVRIARQTVQIPLSKVHYAASQNHIVRVVTDDGGVPRRSDLFPSGAGAFRPRKASLSATGASC